MSTTHTSLGAAADERKARLAKLKSLKRKYSSNEQNTPSTEEQSDVTKRLLTGRNYDVESKDAKLGFENQPNLAAKTTLEQQASEVEQEIRKQNLADQVDKGVDLFKLQPKKPNWDLKRDLDKLLESLNVRTENAITLLVRERIEGSKNSNRLTLDKNKSSFTENEEIGIKGFELVGGVKLREKEGISEQTTNDEEH